VKYKEKIMDSFLIEMNWTPSHFSFAEILHAVGSVPLPPYIKRNAEISDAERYQTIYAQTEGSVAAPTAGLHFTSAILNELELKKIHTAYLTLHVGSATFKPVKSDTMEGHEMHSEYIDVSMDLIDKLITGGYSMITAVGTTSLRTLESLYWLGVKTIIQPDITPEELELEQWDAYELGNQYLLKDSLLALKNWMIRNQFNRLFTKTRLLIVPGYGFKVVDALVTNFHQPQSTLLLLVAAFIGEDWRKVYQYALENNFRFLSYGDGNLYFRKN
jgi:S-adenosylmethionine:tRNA ribosyltransferase-isomerase